MRLAYWKHWIWPNSWWILRYLLPYNKLFHYCWVAHDTMYNINYNKERADEMFYRMMLAVSTNIIQKTFAYIYYKSVVLFWKYFYNKSNFN